MGVDCTPKVPHIETWSTKWLQEVAKILKNEALGRSLAHWRHSFKRTVGYWALALSLLLPVHELSTSLAGSPEQFGPLLVGPNHESK